GDHRAVVLSPPQVDAEGLDPEVVADGDPVRPLLRGDLVDVCFLVCSHCASLLEEGPAKQWLCRRATLSGATPRFARRPAAPAAASSRATVASGYERSLRPCLAQPIAPLRRASSHRAFLREAAEQGFGRQVGE